MDEMTSMLLNKNGMSSYEQVAIMDKMGKKPSNTAIAGIVLGGSALLVGVGAWIFGGVYSAGRAGANERLIESNAQHAREMETLLATQLASERSERVNFTNTQNPSLKDYINVTQSGSQSTSTSSSALASAEATILTQGLLGNLNQCPQKVSLYSSPMPCGCPATGGCGCNG